MVMPLSGEPSEVRRSKMRMIAASHAPANRPPEKNMSQHSSLKSGAKISAKRNVLKRFERVELLKKRGQWKDGDRGLGLRKTKADA